MKKSKKSNKVFFEKTVASLFLSYHLVGFGMNKNIIREARLFKKLRRLLEEPNVLDSIRMAKLVKHSFSKRALNHVRRWVQQTPVTCF